MRTILFSWQVSERLSGVFNCDSRYVLKNAVALSMMFGANTKVYGDRHALPFPLFFLGLKQACQNKEGEMKREMR